MVVRLKEGCKPYTAGDGIDISDNKVISVLLRATNNLIHVNEDGELYTDLQLEDGIEPNDTFPVGITTGKILQEDGWPQNGIIINWKTTSGDYARLILANDGKLYLDPGTGVWQEVGSGGGGGDSNVKLFTPSDLYDITTGQAILNWYQQGKCPLIKYNGDTYVPTSSSGGILFVGMHVNRFSGLNNGVSYTLRPSILVRYEGNVFVSFSEDAVQETEAFISTSVAYNSPFNPTQPYHPATKKYVDDKVTYIGSTAPSSPYEGQVWYDTANDVLKTYDGSQWNQVGGPSANVYVYKGSVTNYSDLANIQNPQAGDVYNVVNAYQSYPAGTNFAWTGTAWDSLGGSIDTSVFVTTNTAQSISGAKTFTAEPVLPNKTADATNSGTAPATEAQVYSVALKTTQISSTAPSSPTEGMLWYDTTNDVLKAYDGTQWNTIGSGGGGASWGSITGTLSDQTDLQNALNAKQDKIIAGTNISIASDGKTISATDTTYSAGTNISISAQNVISATDTTYNAGTSSTLGLIKLGSDTVQSVAAEAPSSTNSRTYPVQVNSSGQAVVNVPWTDSGGSSVVGLTTLSYGNSSWNDFLTAYNAGRIVYCKASSSSDPSSGTQGRMAFMAYVSLSGSTPTSVEFQYYRSVSSHSVSQQGDQVYVYKLTNGGVWSVEVREAYTAIAAGTGLTGSYSNGTYTLSATSSASNLTAVFDIPSTNSDMSSIIQWLTAGGVVVLRENLTIDGHAVEHYYHASVWDGTYGNTISADKIVGTTMTTKTFTYNSGGTCTNVVTTTTSIGGGGGSGDVQVSTQANNILTSGAKLWAGTPSDYAGLSSYDSNTIYLTVTPSS